jgi:hypothetical protein
MQENKKTVKVITQFMNGYGKLESPMYFNLPEKEATELFKYKTYYHFYNYLYANVKYLDKNKSKREIIEPDFVMDFRDDFEDADIAKTYDPTVLADYLEEISNEFDEYGNKIIK